MKAILTLFFLQFFVLQVDASWCSRSATKISSAYHSVSLKHSRKNYLEKNNLFLRVLEELDLKPTHFEEDPYWKEKINSPHLKSIYRLFKKLEEQKTKNKIQSLSSLELRNMAIALSPHEFPYPPFISWRLKHFQYKKYLKEAIRARAEQMILEENLKKVLLSNGIIFRENPLHSMKLQFHRWKPFFQSAVHISLLAGGVYLFQSDALLIFSRFIPIDGPIDLAFLSIGPLLAFDFFDSPSFYYRDLNKEFIRLYKEKGEEALAEHYISEHPVLYAKENTKYTSKSLLSPLGLISYAFIGHMLYSIGVSQLTSQTSDYISDGLKASIKYQEIQSLKVERIDTVEEIEAFHFQGLLNPNPLKDIYQLYQFDLKNHEHQQKWLEIAKSELAQGLQDQLILKYTNFYMIAYNGKKPDLKKAEDFERFEAWVVSNSE
ncbi:MAG: hypothetical protein VX642_07490 [Bdellovibrionota bacterium]|nr:hypothetical protein [Bdellovibrionota bacterium]